jgi:hypothetical protein
LTNGSATLSCAAVGAAAAASAGSAFTPPSLLTAPLLALGLEPGPRLETRRELRRDGGAGRAALCRALLEADGTRGMVADARMLLEERREARLRLCEGRPRLLLHRQLFPHAPRLQTALAWLYCARAMHKGVTFESHTQAACPACCCCACTLRWHSVR